MAQNIDAATMAATNPEISGSDEIIGTVNDKHTRTMADLEARTEMFRQERARLQRVRNCTAVLKVIASMGICGLLFYAWLCSLVAPVVVAPSADPVRVRCGHQCGRSSPRVHALAFPPLIHGKGPGNALAARCGTLQRVP